MWSSDFWVDTIMTAPIILELFPAQRVAFYFGDCVLVKHVISKFPFNFSNFFCIDKTIDRVLLLRPHTSQKRANPRQHGDAKPRILYRMAGLPKKRA